MDFGVAGFDWDEGNRMKCQKHGVPLGEIEQVFRGAPLIMPDRTASTEIRFNAVGLNEHARHVFVVFTLRGHDCVPLIRPLSARYMHRKEIGAYERTKGT